ncbi:MAG: isoprenyl transferase [Oscillospiraceae bacterium]|jgi:undecaprenyl diphosphate synthase|nr:isoprenyl transferase [Oscillospiraceae bacterium]
MDYSQTTAAGVPAHIAIILDGNGRWAKKRGLARSIGHRQGTRALRPVIRHCQELGVRYLTLYVFSTENWNRPPKEIDGIMNLLRENFDEATKSAGENIRIRVLGDVSRLDADLQQQIAKSVQDTAENTGLTVNFALNYGGRQELVFAMRKLAEAVKAGDLQPNNIDETIIEQQLYTSDIPDPDLIIRPSGEQRLSNFLLWQCAYSEFVFMDVLWPDFKPNDLDAAIAEYAGRNRRFGGV